MFTATLIAAGGGLTSGDCAAARDRLAAAGCAPGGWAWIDEGTAADLSFAVDPAAARGALEGALSATDLVVQPAAARRKMVLVADMDSTMITVECIDELADYAGVKAEVAAVTEAAMRGEVDFAGALRARVAMLAGLSEKILQRCYDERVRITPGATALVRTMRAHGARTILVSGGFTFFAARVAAAIGFDGHVANVLGARHGKLDGTVREPIVGAAAKLEILHAEQRGAEWAPTLAIGDGANDLPMIKAASLGVAYRAKPVVAAAAAARIDHGDLSALLYAQGYPRAAWAAA